MGGSLSEAQPPLLEADFQVAYTAEVRASSRVQGSSGQRMNYNDFLTALMKLSIKVYPRSRTGELLADAERAGMTSSCTPSQWVEI